jgi:hypothetical protein
MGSEFEDRFESARRPGANAEARPWLGVRFACAGAYVRVFRNVDGTGYAARCPKCGECIRFRVGSGGTDQRFFEVRC